MLKTEQNGAGAATDTKSQSTGATAATAPTPDARHLNAKRYAQKGLYPLALTEATAALTADPRHTFCCGKLKKLYTQALTREDEFTKVSAQIAAADSKSFQPEDYIRRSALNFCKKDYKAASADANMVLDFLKTKSPLTKGTPTFNQQINALILASLAASADGRHDDAVTEAKKAHDLDSSDKNTLLALGYAHHFKGANGSSEDLAVARVYLRNGSALANSSYSLSEDVLAEYTLAYAQRCAAAAYRIDAADPAAALANAISPEQKLGFAINLANYAATLLDNEDFDGAWDVAQRALQYSPCASAFVVLSCICLYRGDYTNASGHALTATMHDPGAADFLASMTAATLKLSAAAKTAAVTTASASTLPPGIAAALPPGMKSTQAAETTVAKKVFSSPHPIRDRLSAQAAAAKTAVAQAATASAPVPASNGSKDKKTGGAHSSGTTTAAATQPKPSQSPFLSKALALRKQNDVNALRELARQVIDLRTSSFEDKADAHHFLSKIYLAQNDFRKTKLNADSAIVVDARHQLCCEPTQRKANVGANAKKGLEAKNTTQNLDGQASFQRGILYFNLHDYKNACAEANTALTKINKVNIQNTNRIQITNNKVCVNLFIGIALTMQDDFASALPFVKAAYDLDSHDPAILTTLGIIYYFLNEQSNYHKYMAQAAGKELTKTQYETCLPAILVLLEKYENKSLAKEIQTKGALTLEQITKLPEAEQLSIANSFINHAQKLLDDEDLEGARDYANRALAIFTALKQAPNHKIYILLGKISLREHDNNAALDHTNDGMKSKQAECLNFSQLLVSSLDKYHAAREAQLKFTNHATINPPAKSAAVTSTAAGSSKSGHAAKTPANTAASDSAASEAKIGTAKPSASQLSTNGKKKKKHDPWSEENLAKQAARDAEAERLRKSQEDADAKAAADKAKQAPKPAVSYGKLVSKLAADAQPAVASVAVDSTQTAPRKLADVVQTPPPKPAPTKAKAGFTVVSAGHLKTSAPAKPPETNLTAAPAATAPPQPAEPVKAPPSLPTPTVVASSISALAKATPAAPAPSIPPPPPTVSAAPSKPETVKPETVKAGTAQPVAAPPETASATDKKSVAAPPITTATVTAASIVTTTTIAAFQMFNYGPNASTNPVLKTDTDLVAKIHKDPSLLFALLKDIRKDAKDAVYDQTFTDGATFVAKVKTAIPLVAPLLKQIPSRSFIILDALSAAPLRNTYERFNTIGFIAELFPTAHKKLVQDPNLLKWFMEQQLIIIGASSHDRPNQILATFLAITCLQLNISVKELFAPHSKHANECNSFGCKLFGLNKQKIQPLVEAVLITLNPNLVINLLAPPTAATMHVAPPVRQLRQHSDRRQSQHQHQPHAMFHTAVNQHTAMPPQFHQHHATYNGGAGPHLRYVMPNMMMAPPPNTGAGIPPHGNGQAVTTAAPTNSNLNPNLK